jgi:hypothetical protein
MSRNADDSASAVVPAYVALDQGFFCEENLDVTANVVASGATMVPAVLNGHSQIRFANALSVVAAAGKGPTSPWRYGTKRHHLYLSVGVSFRMEVTRGEDRATAPGRG